MSETVTHRGALPPGTRVKEFEFRQVLGHGGFGITYRVWNANLQTTVAVKEYMPSSTAIRESDRTVRAKSLEDEEDYRWGLDRFQDEAKKLARFDHPGIVRVQHYFEAHGTAYMVMEYLEGETLEALFKTEKELGERRLREILAPILEALEEVHAADYLHRDIKPGNIMFRSDGRPVLIDFGAAREAVAQRSHNITAIVAPGYSPIEQYSEASHQGPWTDIYAVGAVLYCGMTGVVPRDATARVYDDGLVPVGEVAAGRFTMSLTDAVDWALRVRGSERPQSIGEWREVLEKGKAAPPPSLGHSGTSGAGEPTAVPGNKKLSVKGRWLVAAVLAAVVAVGVAVNWRSGLEKYFVGSGQTEQTEAEQSASPVSTRTNWEFIEKMENDTYRKYHEATSVSNLEEARKLLGEARKLLEGEKKDELHKDRRQFIQWAEEQFKSLKDCKDHLREKQVEKAKDCAQKLVEDPLPVRSVKEAAKELQENTAAKLAWESAKDTDTMESYYLFEKNYPPRSRYVRLARSWLNQREEAYWKQVQEKRTMQAYLDYLKFYPNGRHVEKARRYVKKAKQQRIQQPGK